MNRRSFLQAVLVLPAARALKPFARLFQRDVETRMGRSSPRVLDGFGVVIASAHTPARAVGLPEPEWDNEWVEGHERMCAMCAEHAGIVVDRDEAYRAYAGALGKGPASLTDAERRLAFQSAVIERLEERCR